MDRLSPQLTSPILAIAFVIAGCRNAEEINQEIAKEACVNHIKDGLKSPSSFNLVEYETYYTPIKKEIDDNSKGEKKYLHLYISYDAENSYGASLRAEHKCTFLIKNGKMQDPSFLKLNASRNAVKNSQVCLKHTQSSQSNERPLACYAPSELKQECCLPLDHYSETTGHRLWE